MRRRTPISPASVNLKALDNRLRTIILPHVAVDKDLLVERRAIDREPQSRRFAGRIEVAGDLGRGLRQIGRRERRFGASRLEAGEIEQGIDQLLQAQAIAARHFHAAALLLGQFAGAVAERLVDRSQHQGERGAELMADIGEKDRLGLIELRHFLVGDAQLLNGLLKLGSPLRDADFQILGVLALAHPPLALHFGQKADADAGRSPDDLPPHRAVVADVKVAENEVDEHQRAESRHQARPKSAERSRDHDSRIKAKVRRRSQRRRQNPPRQSRPARSNTKAKP